MGLQAVGKIVEAGIERDSAAVETSRKIVDFIGDVIPLRVEFLCVSFWRWSDWMSFRDQWIEVNHLNMVM